MPFAERREVIWPVSAREEAAVDGRVQRLHPTVEEFCNARNVRDLLDRNSSSGEGFCRAARGNDRHAARR